MNEGRKSKELGLAGITDSVEDTITARDIIMCNETGVRLHICHCSTKLPQISSDMQNHVE